MNITQIEQNLQQVLTSLSQENYKETFIYDFLLAFGISKTSIKRLQKVGGSNFANKVDQLKNVDNAILWKNKLCFKPVCSETELLYDIEKLYSDTKIMKHDPRFLIVTDYTKFVAIDTFRKKNNKQNSTLTTQISELLQQIRFFLPLIGVEEAVFHSENIADIKAAEKMAKFFDEIKKDNPDFSNHGLNLFLSRLLFCLFANDTSIFDSKLFTKAIHSYTQEDGSDLNSYLDQIFTIMNVKPIDRSDTLSVTINIFPYVNGGLFADNSPLRILVKNLDSYY